ncbi:hypothetical protein A2U01_0094797, partial [Trifolium medium]|nr:hypothetical protein [Trifolium medium]
MACIIVPVSIVQLVGTLRYAGDNGVRTRDSLTFLHV